MAVLATALRDPNVVIRYQAKIVTVPGSDCLWWQGAVSGRGHGRFYVATVVADLGGGDRDLCVIAHRFGYALIYGSATLNAVPVLGHRCDNPLCQRIGPGHVKPSSHAQTAATTWRGGPWRATRWGMPGGLGAGPGS